MQPPPNLFAPYAEIIPLKKLFITKSCFKFCEFLYKALNISSQKDCFWVYEAGPLSLSQNFILKLNIQKKKLPKTSL